jgi:hypothetical protein
MRYGVHQFVVHGVGGAEEATALQEPIARLLCPEPEHEGPCDVPWGFTLREEVSAGGDATVLVLGVYATHEKAATVAERVRGFVGPDRPVRLEEAAPGAFEELAEQFRVENRER